MENKKIFEDVNKLGVPMMVPEEKVDADQTLAEVVKSHDVRLWENFPALFANVSKMYDLNAQKVKDQLKQAVDQKSFQKLLALSEALYDTYHVQSAELNQNLESFKEFFADYKKSVEPLRDCLAHSTHVPVAGVRLSVERLKNTFEYYLDSLNLEQQKRRARHQEFSLEFALSQIFSPKQKELFRKKLNGEPLTKTEREYFSRTVKKKVSALANPELHRLAQRLMG